ncbi:MAG TPA: TrkA C-terminal domain-containing protein [Verrucomicrobiae bacterium]|nr:TrkA C-terminal domain-containing protein [Verrucomicrobiae bacterium]
MRCCRALQTVQLAAASPAAGRLIGELQLRTQTGASIVAIERSGQNILNPGPDEELQAGDQIVLFGSRSHLDAAIRALKGKEPIG